MKRYVKPPDGGWGWVIVLAVWLDNVLCMGVLKTGGIFQPVLQDYFNGGAGTIAWISSISLSMRATAAPLSAALSNRFGERRVVGVGGLLVFTGMLLSSFATSPYYLYVSLGGVAGLGFAFASLPALTMIGRYFNHKRSLANGLSRTGGAGTLFLAPIFRMLINKYGWQGCYLIIAGMELNLLVVALLLRPLRLKSELEFDPQQTITRHDSVRPQTAPPSGFTNGYMARRAIGGQQGRSKEKTAFMQMEARVKEFGITESLIVDNFPAIEPVYNVKKPKLLDFRLLTNPLWMMVTFNLVLCQFGYSMTMVLMCKRAESFGVDSDLSPWLLSITSLSEIVAQLTSGAFADRGVVRRIHLHKIYQITMCLATIYSLFCRTFVSMAIYCFLFGIGSGSWQGNILPITIDTLGLAQLRSAYGFCLFFSGTCGQLIGPPIGGMLYDATNSWNTSFILASCCFFLGFLSLFAEPYAKKVMTNRENKPVKKKTKNDDVGVTQSQTINILKNEMI